MNTETEMKTRIKIKGLVKDAVKRGKEVLRTFIRLSSVSNVVLLTFCHGVYGAINSHDKAVLNGFWARCRPYIY